MLIHCPNCSQEYSFPTELLGEDPFIAQCAACGAPFVIAHEGVVPRGIADTAGEALEARAPGLAEVEDSGPAATPEAPVAGQARPTGPTAIARIEFQRVDTGVGPLVPLPAAETGDYMIVRGEQRDRPSARRRVVFTASRSTGERGSPRLSRVIAHPANFGRGVSPEPTPSPEAVAKQIVAQPPRRRRWPPVVAGAIIVAAGVGVGGIQAVDETEDPVLAAAPGSRPPAPVVLAAPTHGRLTAEVNSIELLPERHAVIVHGHVFNGTSEVQTAIRIDTDLLVDNVLERRREIWCCEALSTEEAIKVLRDPQHFKGSGTPDQARVKIIDPDAAESFSVVFPAINDDAFSKTITGELRMKEVTRLPAN